MVIFVGNTVKPACIYYFLSQVRNASALWHASMCIYNPVSGLECLAIKRNLSLFVQTFDFQLQIWQMRGFRGLEGF